MPLRALSNIHTLIRWMDQGRPGVQHLAEGHFEMQTGWARDQTSDLSIGV